MRSSGVLDVKELIMLNGSGLVDTMVKSFNVVEIYILLSWKLRERGCKGLSMC